jgi:hypothetical protein
MPRSAAVPVLTGLFWVAEADAVRAVASGPGHVKFCFDGQPRAATCRDIGAGSIGESGARPLSILGRAGVDEAAVNGGSRDAPPARARASPRRGA